MTDPSGVPEKPANPHDHRWFDGLAVEQQQAVLTAWFAAIASGCLEAAWSTLGQRLEYVQIMAGLTAEQWSRKAGISESTISSYINGKRAKSGQALQPETIDLLLTLIREAGQNVDLPWLLGGSQRWMEEDGFWGRARWTLLVAFGPKKMARKNQ